MRNKSISTITTPLRVVLAALLVFAALPLAFGSVSGSQKAAPAAEEAAPTASDNPPSFPLPASDAGTGSSGSDAPAASQSNQPADDAGASSQPASPQPDQPAGSAPDVASDGDAPKPPPAEEQQHADSDAPPDIMAPLGPSLDEFISGLPGSAMRTGFPGSGLLNRVAPLGVSAAPTASADPPGFAWKFTAITSGPDAGACKITGYTVNGFEPPLKGAGGSELVEKVTVSGGTVHVPATALVDGTTKKVVGIEKNTKRLGDGYYKYLKCGIDFSQAVNLKSIGSSAGFDFAASGLTGTIDLSKCTQLTAILTSAFNGSPGINSLILPPNLKTINTNAFQNCTALGGTIAIPASVTTIGGSSFSKAPLTGLQFATGSQLSSIGDSAFSDSHITGKLTMPSSLTNVGVGAFSGNRITDLEFAPGSRLTKIKDSAFRENQIAGTLVLPDSVIEVGNFSFYSNKVAAVKFGKNAVKLDTNCFEKNKISRDPLKGYTFNGLGARCFADNDIDSIDFSGDTNQQTGSAIVADNINLTSVVLSPNWLKIADELFSGDAKLANVSFPLTITGDLHSRPSLTNIGAKAFQGCTSLETIDFKNAPLQNTTAYGAAINSYAFQGCTSLKEIILGTQPAILDIGVNKLDYTVGTGAFQGCTALKGAIIPPKPLVGHVYYHIGDEAFKDTDLGNYANSDHAIPGVPLGTLPLMGREIQDIGARAYMNSNLTNVWLPSSLNKVGSSAFADNHMGSLELPNNPALDASGAVGANILANQTAKGAAFYGNVMGSKADIIMRGIKSSFGADVSHMTSLGVKVGGSAPTIAPDNSDWGATVDPTFNLSDLKAPGTSFVYDLGVWRKGGDRALSTGDVTVPKIEEGVPFEFKFYNNADFSSLDSDFIQWVGVGDKPVETLAGVPNFGTAKPGYRTQSGAYTVDTNAGWRWAESPGAGTSADTPVDPATVAGVKGAKPVFYNRWLANSHSVKFDDNFDYMFAVDNTLGTPDPKKAGSFLPEPNKDLIWGSLPDKDSLTFGTAEPLPKNQPPGSAGDAQGVGFKMGSYQFVGWATSPNLAQSDRVPGKNFFADGAQISTPDPAPDDGGAVTLYAQWQAKDPTQDPVVNGSIMIPARIQMQQDGAHLWSKSPDPQDILGFTGSLPPDAVPIWAVQGGPGASWPADISYNVFVKRAAPDSALLTLSSLASDGTLDAHAVDVLKAKDGSPYDPGADPDNPDNPLITLSPNNDAQASGVFYLRTRDKPWDFLPNVSYAGTMTFVLKQVGP